MSAGPATRWLSTAITLVSTTLMATLLTMAVATYQHAQKDLADLMRVVGRDVLLLERDWSRREAIVTPDFERELREFVGRLPGFQMLALRAGGGRPTARFAYLTANVTPEYFAVRNYPLARGRAFLPGRREAVVGHDLGSLLGKRIVVRREIELHVVGVLSPVSERGGPDWITDGTVFVPYDLRGLTVPNEAYIKFASEQDLTSALLVLTRWLEARGHPYRVRPLAELYGLELLRRIREVLGGALLWGLLAAALVAGVNLATYSLARALERIRELGIRRAVGATASALALDSLYGSLRWALVGTVLGPALALVLSGRFVPETGLRTTPTVLSVAAVALGLVVLVLASTYPVARWTAAQPPAGAIRGIAADLPQRNHWLALIGLALGLAALAAQFGIARSADAHARRMVGGISRDTAIYTSFLYLRRHSLTDPRGATPLGYRDYRALMASDLMAGLDRIAFVENYRRRIQGPRGTLETFVRVYEGPYPDLAGARTLLGRWPRPGAGEVALGRKLAEQLFGEPREALGRAITVFGRKWTVAGVYAGAAQALPGNAAENQALLTREDLKRTLPGARAEILIKKRPDASERVFGEVGRFLTARHPDPGLHPVEPIRRDDLVPELREVLARLAWAYGLLARVILALAAVGVLAQTMMNVQYRFRELGVRRATGATRSRLLVELVSPWVRASLLAGVAGAMLGLGAAYVVVRVYGGTWDVPWSPLLLVALAALVLAGLAAALPAWLAAGASPAEAMRVE